MRSPNMLTALLKSHGLAHKNEIVELFESAEPRNATIKSWEPKEFPSLTERSLIWGLHSIPAFFESVGLDRTLSGEVKNFGRANELTEISLLDTDMSIKLAFQSICMRLPEKPEHAL